ncbi:unnamed protein product [Knipowitschia caucasica]
MDLKPRLTTPQFTTTITAPTTAPPPPESRTGLAVGLSLFFVLLVVGAVGGFLAYRKFGKLRRVLSFGSRRRIEKERDAVSREAPKVIRENHTVRSEIANANAAATPIYENVVRIQSSRNTPAARSNPPPEDDLYLQCDAMDAIYTNDPACSSPSHHQDDDTYILPDS